MDFDFRTFSTRSFERFAQAMAMHVLGKGLFVFGDGPDGAREAVYDGVLSYPSEANGWSGYTIMQAKFRQVPGTPREDADWLAGQLRRELDKFTEPDTKLRKPENYILVSNAKLSPVPESKRSMGGIAKLDSVFSEYKKKIGIRDYRIWHLDQLSTMLLGAESIRRAYAAWLSSSDVIADMLDTINAESASLSNAMYRYLSRELRSHQPVRLQQAGHAGDAQIMIEDIFIDLPYRLAGQQENVLENQKLLLANLLGRSRDCLDGASVVAQQDRDTGRPERVLLLGGPGQGKSTLSQFLAQILRAKILHSDQTGKYTADVGRVIDSTLKKATAAGLDVDVPIRFPLRVDLPNFADWLSAGVDGSSGSLLHYVAHHITKIANESVQIKGLRKWISNYPAILILDGLDEVPPSANRASVLRAISEFWDETTNADLLMVVTTRPQGYNDDLDPAYYTKLEMTSLAPRQAIAYAQKLATVRISDPLQCERVVSRFVEAARSETTNRLMVSPLQVAILLALIDQRGDAPTDRWSLFDRYFAVVLQREQGKAGAVGKTMRHWSRQISAIHYKAGFLLQVEAETKGNSEASLAVSELRELIRGQLADEEFEGEPLRAVTDELLGVSTERLVLLVQRAEGRFSFEVRSLQEFMAAAYLMTGREVIVQKRLRVVANRSHWLHVFQIAASKCFSVNDSEQYRDTIVTVCRDINENGEEIDRLLRTGSKLALALLDDGLAYDQPKYRRLLLSAAFDVLLAGPILLPDSLNNHCIQEPARTIEHLRRYLSSQCDASVQAAWKLILRCSSKEQAWAEAFLEEIWPKNPAETALLFAQGIESLVGSTLHTRMRRALEFSSPIAIIRALDRNSDVDDHRRSDALLSNHPSLRLMSYERGETLSVAVKINGIDTPLSLQISMLEISAERRLMYDDIPDTAPWAPQRALREFHENPNEMALADLLDQIVQENWKESFEEMNANLPWPLQTLFFTGNYDSDLTKVAEVVRAGGYGREADWRKAETRWQTQGIVDNDFKIFTSGNFFDERVADCGSPYWRLSITHGNEESAWVDQIFIYALASRGMVRSYFRGIFEFVAGVYPLQKPMSLEMASFLIEESEGSSPQRFVNPRILNSFPHDFLNEKKLLERLDQLGRSGKVYFINNAIISTELYEALIAKTSEFHGLIVFLCNLLAVDRSEDRFHLVSQIASSTVAETEDPEISSYVNALSIFTESDKEKAIESILNDVIDEEPSRAMYLMRQLLENKYLKGTDAKRVAEGIANVVNKNPRLPYQFFITRIQGIANGRVADLHESDAWRSLDLGESLLGLLINRRKSG